MSNQINSGSGSGGGGSGGGSGGGIGSGNGSACSGDSIGSVKLGSGCTFTPPQIEAAANNLSTTPTTAITTIGTASTSAPTTTTMAVIGSATTAGLGGGVAQTTDAVAMHSGGSGGNNNNNSNNMAVDCSPRESGEDESEDESEILEESPCGRWLKRREEVDQRDVPGIDCVHLAMDTEEGVEVVWNEVQYASLQELKSQEDKMRQVFDNLLQLDHQNIVKFHRYWTDTQNAERPRVIFITEYMSSGSLKQFLKRTKRNAKRLPLEAWRRWCTQILSALSYLHSCIPPVIHGNLTCDSIFIQHNGLVKIGSVVPDAVHYSVRQQHKIGMMEQSMLHFMAPEYGLATQLTAAVDIYAFGMCALEMAALEIQPSGSGSDPSAINDETILRTINSLEHDLQRDLIFKCLRRNPSERPSASDLLFHPLLFEVHSLKLLAAHCLVFSPKNRTMFSETVIDGMLQRYNRPEVVLAKIACSNNEGQQQEYRLADVPSADKLEKFVEDVKYGVYPLTAFSGKKPPHFRSRAASPERADSVKSATPEPVDVESRRIVNMVCSVKKMREDSNDISMTILLRMDDKMNRQLTCQVTEDDSALDLTGELVRLGFVHIDDQDKIQALLEETLRSSFAPGSAAFEYGAQPLTFSATINEHPLVGASSSGSIGAMIDGNIINSSSSGGSATTLKTTTTMATALNQLERNWSIAESNADSVMTAASSMGPGGAATLFNPQSSQFVMSGSASGGGGASTSAASLPKSTVTVVMPVQAIEANGGGSGSVGGGEGGVGVVPYLQQIQQPQQQQQHHQEQHQLNEAFGGMHGTDIPYTTTTTIDDGALTLTAVVAASNNLASSASTASSTAAAAAAIPTATEITIANTSSASSASATASTIN